nr:very short patch repair endonuclease [Heliomicrobium undosum]
MSAISGKDTSPEVRLRKALWAAGFRYRINKQSPWEARHCFRQVQTGSVCGQMLLAWLPPALCMAKGFWRKNPGKYKSGQKERWVADRRGLDCSSHLEA